MNLVGVFESDEREREREAFSVWKTSKGASEGVTRYVVVFVELFFLFF